MSSTLRQAKGENGWGLTMDQDNVKLGRLGEDAAASYLQNAGFKILDRNVRTRSGEIDLVASKKGELYFVEVKTRGQSSFGAPLESLPFYRQKRLAQMAQWYLRSKKISAGTCYHLSLMGIDASQTPMKLEFLPDITL